MTAYLQLQIGGYKCVNECDRGYRLIDDNCVDVDECAEKTADCDRRANCENTIGGYQCTCEDGFAGDGRTCTRMRTLLMT